MIGAAISRWTISYFFAALMSLLIAVALMLSGFGYPSASIDDPDTLVVVHVLAIGWLSLLFFGALLQFIPILVSKPLRAAWVAAPALLASVAGLGCLVTGFLAMGGHLDVDLVILPIGAGCLALGFGALSTSFLATLLSARPLNIPGRLVALGLISLAATILTGAAFSTVLSGTGGGTALPDLLGIGVPFHAAFGLLGWMTVTALGVSYKLFTMFMLAPEGGRNAGLGVFCLALASLGSLAVALGAKFWTIPYSAYVLLVPVLIMLATVAVYLRDVAGIYKARRRKELELNILASLVALWFLFAGIVTLSLSALVDDGARLAAMAVYLLSFGWLSGLGLGQLYKIVPFLTWLECYGPVMGRVTVPRVQDLVNEKRAVSWFWLYYGGAASGAACLLFEATTLFQSVTALQALAIMGLIFEYLQARRLSYAPLAIRQPAGSSLPHLLFSHTLKRN